LSRFHRRRPERSAGLARKFAREHELIVVLKGTERSCSAKCEAWVNTTGNPECHRRTGDILTGMVAGMIAQNPNDALLLLLPRFTCTDSPATSARSVGEHSMVATDLLRGLPEASGARNEPS